MKRIFTLAVMFAATLLIFACQKEPGESPAPVKQDKKPGAVVATVDGVPITQGEFNDFLVLTLGIQSQHTTDVEDKFKDAALKQLIGRRLLVKAAKKEGLDITEEEYAKRLEAIHNELGGEDKLAEELKNRGVTVDSYEQNLRHNMILEKMVEDQVPSDSVTEEAIMDYYENSPEPFFKPARINVRFIETKTIEEARQILDEMKEKNISFDTAADSYQENTRITVSGYGWTVPDFFAANEELYKAMKELKAGQHGGPYKGKMGYFLIRIKEREDKSIKSPEEARDEIRAKILNEMRQHTMDQLVLKYEKEAVVEIK